MSQVPSRGPLNQMQSPRFLRDGTTPPSNGDVPGPECSSSPSGILEYARRVGDVKDALSRAIEKYAYNESVKKLGSDLTLIVDSLWPGFVQALEIYAYSIGGGAVLFGVAGALIGEGVGAVPGAFLGAKIGAEIGTAILYFLGIKFLAEYVLSHLGEASKYFGVGFDGAWRACGSPAAIDQAAQNFGKAIANLFSLVLQAAVAWVIKKGLKAGLEELNKSEAGRALAPYAKTQYWREKLGVTDAPVPRRGIGTTIEFFEEQVRKGNLKPEEFTNENKLASYWKGMDFSKEIKTETLQAGKELVGYRDPASPYGYYYAEVGTYLDKLGVDYVTKTKSPLTGLTWQVERQFFRYRVRTTVEVLKSTSSGVRAWDTGEPVPGGAIQYFIPRAWEVLEITQSPPAPPSFPGGGTIAIVGGATGAGDAPQSQQGQSDPAAAKKATK